MNFSLLFIGILIGLLIQKYIFPIVDLWLSVYEYKQSEKATIYNLNAQEQVALFNREYPELDENQNKELTPAIGFAYNRQDDDDIYYEDCKKTIK